MAITAAADTAARLAKRLVNEILPGLMNEGLPSADRRCVVKYNVNGLGLKEFSIKLTKYEGNFRVTIVSTVTHPRFISMLKETLAGLATPQNMIGEVKVSVGVIGIAERDLTVTLPGK